jgi:hypothetical protein
MKIIKWIARITGFLSVVFFLAFMIGEGIPGEGGIILIFISIIMGLYLLYLSENNVIAAIIYCLPFLIPGVLFLVYDYKKQ